MYVRWYAHGADRHPHKLRDAARWYHTSTCLSRACDYKQNDTVWFTSLANEDPEQWYTSVTLGFKDALAKGLAFSEMKVTRQNHLEDFAGSFFRSTDVPGPRQECEEANTRRYWADSGIPITQLLVPGLFAKQGCVHVVSSSRLQGTKSSTRRS